MKKINPTNVVENLNNDIDETVKSIKDMLNSSNNKKYTKMILLLIKRGIINKEFVYVETFLNQIIMNKFHFNYKKFESSFYTNVIKENYDLANIDYEILCAANELFFLELDTDLYKSFLSDDSALKEKVKKIYSEVLNTGLKVIESNKEEETKIFNIFSKLKKIKCFYIGEGINKKLVIRDFPYIEGKISKVKEEADNAYENRQYHKAIREYKKILTLKEVYSNIYAKMALCYYKLNDIHKAIEYVYLANDVVKNEEFKGYTYDSLLKKLILESNDNEYKPIFSEEDNHFDFIEEENFGLGDISDITDFINKTGLDIESACRILLINEEDMNLLRLAYAKSFYMAKEYVLGDKFLKAVEQSEYKTDKINCKLNILKNNKKLYCNQKNSTTNFSLKLRPKK